MICNSLLSKPEIIQCKSCKCINCKNCVAVSNSTNGVSLDKNYFICSNCLSQSSNRPKSNVFLNEETYFSSLNQANLLNNKRAKQEKTKPVLKSSDDLLDMNLIYEAISMPSELCDEEAPNQSESQGEEEEEVEKESEASEDNSLIFCLLCKNEYPVDKITRCTNCNLSICKRCNQDSRVLF